MPVSLHRLPSLDLLRGFVAVGRRMSITLAANDLCITQSAVSRQIRALEDALGVKLLVRKHRSIALTPEGESLFHTADKALQQLQDAVGAVQPSRLRRPVAITCSAGMSGLWLVPRLRGFLESHSTIEVRLSASDKVSDLKQDGNDLAIRYCSQENAPEGAVKLFGETVQPIAHPRLGIDKITKVDDLKNLVLLDFDGPYRPWLRWSDWLAYQGWGEAKAKPKRIMRFNQYDQVVQAALDGQGVALGRLGLIDTLVDEGRLALVTGSFSAMPNTYGYWLVQAEKDPRAEVVAVANWIREQAAHMDLQPPSLTAIA